MVRKVRKTYIYSHDYSQDYLLNLINRGQLKAHKKGKLWYVRVISQVKIDPSGIGGY
jgi:hypothetical protein